jgi:hypothetical protein
VTPLLVPPANLGVKLLAAFLLTTIVLGSLYVLYRIYGAVKKYLRVRPFVHCPSSIASYIMLTIHSLL